MILIFVWALFIITMSFSVLNRKIDTFHYILFSLVLLYMTYIYKETKFF
jgi:hypothetical protein